MMLDPFVPLEAYALFSLLPRRLSEAERDLEAVRSQLRQHAARKKHLEDVCAQLDCTSPPLAPTHPSSASSASAPSPSGEAAAGREVEGSEAAGEIEWRAQRLECLMYR